MSIKIKKTAFIGLGGTGQEILLHLKNNYLKTYGEIPPMVKFVCFDTDSNNELFDGKTCFDPSEFFRLRVRDPRALINTSKEVQAWIYDGTQLPRFALVNNSAKGVRAFGRLSVFANGMDIEAIIAGLISSLRDITLEVQDKYEPISNAVSVYIVGSIAGGTGSGCFIDISGLAKAALHEGEGDKLHACFLMPGVFLRLPGSSRLMPNAYAALKEINYFMMNDTEHTYDLAGVRRTIRGRLYDRIFLINNENARGVVSNNFPDLCESIGMGIYLLSHSAGRTAANILDNLESQMCSEKMFGMPTVFSSFGLSELIYDSQQYVKIYLTDIALRLIQTVFTGGTFPNINEETEEFIDRSTIREYGSDQVIDAILGKGDINKFSIPKKIDKKEINSVYSTHASHIDSTTRDCVEITRSNTDKIINDKTGLLQKEIDRRANKPQGLENSKNFLLTLLGSLQEYKMMMTTEMVDYEAQKAELDGCFPNVKNEITMASKKFFGAKSAIEDGFKKYTVLVNKEATCILEIERRKGAIELFTHLINTIDENIDRINTILNYCHMLTDELAHKLQHDKLATEAQKPFVINLAPAFLENMEINIVPEYFMPWLNKEKGKNVLELGGGMLDEIKDILDEYGMRNEQIKLIQNKKLNDILKELSKKEFTKLMAELNNKASVLWKYDRGKMPGEHQTANICIFGVDNRNNSVIDPDTITPALDPTFMHYVVSTGDSNKIFCLKIETAIPAFMLQDMPRYRDHYMSASKPFPYHIDKNWEEGLPSLFPSTYEGFSVDN